MAFRFSMKLLLGGMVYVAVAAAAFSQQAWAYADVLWIANLLIFGYAVLVSCYARGATQARAVGFAVLAACYLVCLYLAPDSLPAGRLLSALASQPPVQTVTYSYGATMPTPAVSPTATSPYGAPPVPSPPIPAISGAVVRWAAPAVMTTALITPVVAPQQLRAANAVATIGAGFVGALLGAVAFRQSQKSR